MLYTNTCTCAINLCIPHNPVIQIQSWLYKATMCGFNLVPAPMLQTLSQDRGVSAHPFQQQYFIPLKLPATFPGWSDSEAMYGLSFNVAMHKLFDAIISKWVCVCCTCSEQLLISMLIDDVTKLRYTSVCVQM